MNTNMADYRKIFIALIGFSLLLVTPSFSATYYVRTDGGSATQCTGTADAPYPGAGSGQPCAFSHPFWAIAPQGNNPTKMVGGDTLIIDGSNSAEYMIGYKAPNTSDTSKCASSWSWDCYMRSIPSGPDPSHPTRLLGKGWNTGCSNPPQLWGTERVKQVLSLAGSSNVELQCLEITDHSSCQDSGPNPCNRSTSPFGPWSLVGLAASDSTNVLLKNVNIHGMAHGGVYAGRLKDWTVEDSKIVANSFVGWDGDIGATTSSNSGTLTFNNVKILFNGCGETYPGETPYNCYSQDQGGYGDGLGTAKTAGDWIFNKCDFSHNVSDGLDLLYHTGNGSITIKRSRFEGNAGNQVKVAASAKIENSILIGNCAYFKGKSFTWNSSTFNNCRAQGNTLAVAYHPGMTASLNNSTLTGNGDVLVQTSGSNCLGTEKIVSRNNIFLGRTKFFDPTVNSALYWAAGATGNGDGACGQIKQDDDYSAIWSTKTVTTDCNNKPHSICQDPKLVEPLVQYYSGDAYSVNLQSSSPARDKGSVLTGMSGLDYNEFNRGATWDTGALEFGSTPTAGSSAPVCGNGTVEDAEQCDDGNTSNGDGCSSTCQTEASLVNGTCGSSNNSCSSGTLNDVTDSSSNYLWNCVGSSGGTTASCSAAKSVAVNGACGVSNNSCTVGALSDTADSSTYYLWNCSGSNGGTTASCSLIKTVSPVSGACGATNNSCSAGSLSDMADSTTYYLWNCLGLNGGPMISCNLPKPVVIDGACAATNNSCATGTLSDIVDSSTYYLWDCLGSNGGTTDSCNLPKPVAINGICGASNNSCSAGLLSDTVDSTNDYLWSCLGSNGGTTASCSMLKPPSCGNGVKEGAEICDDGNTVSNDGCSSTCRAEWCGNGVLEGTEQCDDGNWKNRDGCSAICKLEGPACGNGKVEGSEQCDDGNFKNGDGCTALCMKEANVCGNGIKESDEGCDDGNHNNNDGCNSMCKVEWCGDNVRQATEQCDDGNYKNGDGCSALCKFEGVTCGNGIKEGKEICDDGNLLNNDGCNSLCKAEWCGNGIREGAEQCDDGNWKNRDGCSALCKKE